MLLDARPVGLDADDAVLGEAVGDVASSSLIDWSMA